MRLTSWVEKSPDWCSPDELIALHTRVQSMVTKNIKLVDVTQVMLVRQILPCQRRSRPLWEFNPKKHHTLKRLFGTTHEDVWKLLRATGHRQPHIQTAGTTLTTSPTRYVILMHPLLACFKDDI